MAYKKDDVLVSLATTAGGRKEGDIIVMQGSVGYVYGNNKASNLANSGVTDLRYATDYEILCYKRGIRNISEIKESQPLPIFN